MLCCFAALGILCFTACESEIQEIASPQINTLESRNPNTDCEEFLEGIRVEDGMLHFRSAEQMKLVYECLEKQQAAHLKEAYAPYEELSDEAFDEMEEAGEIQIDDYLVLRTFERKLGFQSLRLILEKAELEWLQSEELDIENDPDDHFVIDEVFRTLLSVDASVMIAGELYQFNEEEENTIEERMQQSDCRSMKGKSYNKYNSSYNRRIKCSVAHVTYPWGRYALARTKNYFKKRRRIFGGYKWKIYRTYTVTRVYGHISDAGGVCKGAVNFNPSGSYRWGNRRSLTHRISVSTKTRSGWVRGYHYGGSGINNYTALTW